METRLSLQDRVIASIREAERLSTELERLKALGVGKVDFGLLQVVLFKWDTAMRQAVHLCRLALLSLPEEALPSLIDRVNDLEEGRDVWEQYVLAEGYGEWSGFVDDEE